MKVTAIQTHHGDFGLIAVGETYETDQEHAQQLVNNGLVKAEGITSTGKKTGYVGELLVNDKPKEKAENKTGNVPTAKKRK